MARSQSGVRWAAARRTRPRQIANVHLAEVPRSQHLLRAVDCGPPIIVDPDGYVAGREPGWGPHLDAFLVRNRPALQYIGVDPRVVSGREGVRLELHPGLRAGAVPLRSAISGKVAGGLVVSPRFGWPGVGRILALTGWGSGPEFLNLPLVPGSGREVPPWVLAGPVLHRLTDLLANLRPGYREKREVRQYPRGQIEWGRYITRQLPTARWHHLPCRFSELEFDTRLRQAVRWTLERLHRDLATTGGTDPIAVALIGEIMRLVERVVDVCPRRPNRGELDCRSDVAFIGSPALREGLRAMGWVADERGLGGGRTSDGLAWALPLEALWERYVERVVRNEAALTGGRVRSEWRGETTIPLTWNDPSHRALGHLVPDLVVQRRDEIEIVDAKYKSHFADLDATRWSAQTEEIQTAMRADIHQVLAYVATLEPADNIRATLVYPVRPELFETLALRNRTESRAVIFAGRKQVTLCLRALAFTAAA